MPKPSIAESEIISLRARLAAKTKTQGECEVWQGDIHKGYGRVQVKGKKWRVHRLTWILERGPIPDGLGVLHTCDNPPCRKLSHLFLGDSLTNNRDRDSKGRGSAGRRERHGHAKLTEAAVKEIRLSDQPARIFAKKFGVTIETVRRARRGNSW